MATAASVAAFDADKSIPRQVPTLRVSTVFRSERALPQILCWLDKAPYSFKATCRNPDAFVEHLAASAKTHTCRNL